MVSPLLYACAAVLCLVWAGLLLIVGRGATALFPAAACLAAAAWAGITALAPTAPMEGLPGALEIVRDAVWFGLLLNLYSRVAGPPSRPMLRHFGAAAGAAAILALACLAAGAVNTPAMPTFGSPALLARLALALLIVLLAENLYRNADEAARWHVNLPCVALGGLAAFDVLIFADAALSQAFSPALLDARAALTALAAPLLAIAAVRDRRWRRDPPMSRQAVFHGATLFVAGAFLLGVGALGEALRHLGIRWAPTAQAGLLAGAVMALAVAGAAGSVRSRLRHVVVDHFFTARYDYRREWLRCVATLSAPDARVSAPVRAIRAVADPADSPAGVLLVRETSHGDLRWGGSWNSPSGMVSCGETHPLSLALGGSDAVVVFGPERPPPDDLAAVFGPLWLAVPLLHHREGLTGAVLLGPPRAPFTLDREAMELLRTLGQEVAMFLAERRAAERLAEERPLREYAKRFAFVAHDVKTVSSQLTLLLANAEENIGDPEFQRDMLLTVRASAARIDTLIARLRQPETLPDRARTEAALVEPPQADAADLAVVAPLDRLRGIVAAQSHPVQVEADEWHPPGRAAMAPERFDAAVGHLLNNAAEASGPQVPVRIRVRGEAGRMVVEIIDHGPGMTADFIRDELFRPLRTSKPGGSGIGAWQARELVREAGGDLAVLSRPGAGTTMRLVLPTTRGGSPAAATAFGA